MSKQAIFISRSFAPLNNIASVRQSKIVKYLLKNGWSIRVYSEQHHPQDVLDTTILDEDNSQLTVIRLPVTRQPSSLHLGKRTKQLLSSGGNYTSRSSRLYKTSSSIKSIIQEVFQEVKFYRYVVSALAELPDEIDCDLIFSSYKPFGSHWAAAFLKRKKARKAIWIADFRDLPTDDKNLLYPFRFLVLLLQSRIVRDADGIITVSEGLKNRLIGQTRGIKDETKILTIHNGFDPDDLKHDGNKRSEKNKLVIAYTGTVHEQSREDASMLFNVISELVEEGKISIDDIVIRYAGKKSGYVKLLQQAHKYGVEKIIEDNGYLPRHSALEIQSESDILLLLTWNTSTEQGILTGKLFEYIGMNRQIVALIKGDQKDSEVSKILYENQLGYSFYYADGEKAKDSLKDLIKNYVTEKKLKHEISHSPTKCGVEDYSYPSHIAKLINFYEYLRSV